MTNHHSVLLNESIEALNIKKDGIYIDGTFGRGGHSTAILQQLGSKGRVIAIDKDMAAVKWAQEHFEKDKRFSIQHNSFSQIGRIAEAENLSGQIDGILLDLGVSSPQLDEAERGFSFMKEGPLDMRMDVNSPLSAAVFVNTASVGEMSKIFKSYGEERYSLRIAKAIERAREQKFISKTTELAEIVKAAHPKWEKHKHPATRVFQAIRIHVNAELEDLKKFLAQTLEVLAPGGRLAVISFHSLEDRIVKTFLRDESRGKTYPAEIPVRETEINVRLKPIGKAIKPTLEEINANIRARSAVLRIGEKLK